MEEKEEEGKEEEASRKDDHHHHQTRIPKGRQTMAQSMKSQRTPSFRGPWFQKKCGY